MPEEKPGSNGNGMSRGGFLRNLTLLLAGLGAGAGPLPRLIGPPGERPVRPSAPSLSVKRRA